VYHLTDALGSVRQLVDASGTVKLAQSYEPYGSVACLTAAAISPHPETETEYYWWKDLMAPSRNKHLDGTLTDDRDHALDNHMLIIGK
jgi:hypothetical protein